MAQTNVTSPRTKPTNSHSIPEKEAQLVTLKVNRIYRPSFALEDVVTHEKSDLTSASLLYRSSSRFANAQITSTGVNNLCLSPMLIVPIYNGDISLGEVFSCYISIYNHSEQSVQNVALKVELQTQTQKVTAFDSMHSEQQTNTQVLQPGSTADFIVRHAVWELGTHIMICNVSYQKHSGEKKQLKKFFKFQVTNSLTFDYKVALTQGEFIVESTLTNVTKGPLYIESAEFLAEEYFNVLELNPNQNTLNLPPSVSKSVGPLVYIQSGDARKFAFKLIYRNPFDPNIINSNVLGRFRFQWKSSFGDPASLTTEPITINFTQDRSVGQQRFSLYTKPLLKNLTEPMPSHQPVRLYTKAKVMGYRRSKSNQYPNVTLLKIEGVKTRKDTQFYLGKRVAFLYRARRNKYTKNNIRIIWGTICRHHGNTGAVRARFKKNLPPKAVGATVRVMLYPSRI
jgi:large subunit ribosomal protein L35Ae